MSSFLATARQTGRIPGDNRKEGIDIGSGDPFSGR